MKELNWYETFRIDENINNDVNDIIGELIQDYRNQKEINKINK